ncbi:phosphomannomutase [Vibrio panuliri]|uniref:Phosphomannomutase n=2 Tax=Vibrio panuliri TaxID=1381081 RepID=A0ABX3FI75_9VIBR|nr:phosphomannomutase [Vibrio panuliri]OLQ93889.1 phosphomannomutase [Vibrio panuliri]
MDCFQVIQNSGVKFGTSGARGLVEQFTPDTCAAFTHAFISTIREQFSFSQVAVAIDNRPSSLQMAKACCAALKQLSIDVVFYGVIPTPALAFSAMADDIPSIMVTGSHIPFDRNGLKFYRPDGEITKCDEQAIMNNHTKFSPLDVLPDLNVEPTASRRYIRRYTSLFEKDFLTGLRIGIYEHSSSGRDLYSKVFSSLGAEVIQFGRTDTFVPIDTEAVDDSDKKKAKGWSSEYKLDFIFSTDGDGDRPLVADENGDWLRGDVLGALCSKALEVEAVALPISCNTMIDEYLSGAKIKKTKIGSPFVLSSISELKAEGYLVAGFEANGGYLLGCDTAVNGRELKALPTRDALLPALMLLFISREQGIGNLVDSLPKRFTDSDRIQNFSLEKSNNIIRLGRDEPNKLLEQLGYGKLRVLKKDLTDGLRLELSDNSILHLRPSGNAPELRCYAEASSMEKAESIVKNTLMKVCSI